MYTNFSDHNDLVNGLRYDSICVVDLGPLTKSSAISVILKLEDSRSIFPLYYAWSFQPPSIELSVDSNVHSPLSVPLVESV